MELKNNKIIVSLILAFASLFLFASGVSAAAFNNSSKDLEMLTLENRTVNPGSVNAGSANWRDPISASAGDEISFRFYYHNTETGTTANNVRLRIAYPSSASSIIVSTGSILSDNASTVTDTGTINVSSSQSLIFESAIWYPNQTTTGGTNLSLTNTGGYVEVNIGNINGGWPSQGNVVFRARVSSASSNNPPIVNAGNDLTVNENQSAALSGATATDPDGDALTYSWTCTGGTLSSATVLNPTYVAPSVSADTTYTCTLTATDSKGAMGVDSLSVTVKNTNSGGATGYHVVSDRSVEGRV